MVDYIGLLVIVILLALFVFLLTRALRARNGVLKWVGTILFGLFSLVFLAVLVLAGIGTYKFSVPAYTYPPVSDVKVAGTPEQIEKGRRFAMLCADCHASQGGGSEVLDGGPDFLAGPDAPPFPMGVVHPSNLTKGGEMKDWSDGDIIRAIREGVHKSGRPLIIMPSMAFNKMSDEDVQALVAYLKTMPAVEDSFPKNKMNVISAVMFAAGMFPPSIVAAQPPSNAPAKTPAEGTVEKGEYLSWVMGCRDCHGLQLEGSNTPDMTAPNLTVIVPAWTEAQFIQVFRTGTDPTGKVIDKELMPIEAYGNFLTDQELKDMHLYMSGLEPVKPVAQP